MWWVGCLVLVFGFMGAMVVEAHKAAYSHPAWSQKKTLPDGGSRSRSPPVVKLAVHGKHLTQIQSRVSLWSLRPRPPHA